MLQHALCAFKNMETDTESTNAHAKLTLKGGIPWETEF